MDARLSKPLMFLLAKIDHQTVLHAIDYLKTENEVLRAQAPDRLQLSPADRQKLIKAGKPLGINLRDIITVAAWTTFLRWTRETAAKPGDATPAKVGRPETPAEVQALIVKLASENPSWGYGRIRGELKKLNVQDVCENTIRSILKEHGMEPAPNKPQDYWSDFLKRHAQTLWACDFVSKKILTKTGFVDCFVLFYIHVATRRVHLGGVTVNPSAAWMTQQARNTAMFFEEQDHKPIILIHDRDGKFTPQYDRILEDSGVTIKRLPARSPNLNAFAERWVLSFRRECLDYFLVFGESHMRLTAETCVNDYYNQVRPHQSLENKPLAPPASPPPTEGKIACQTWLGGVLKHYHREAA